MGATKKAAKKRSRGPIIPLKYVLAVEQGVKFLDLVFGRKAWLKRMDMSNFDISDPRTCVAGWVFKDAWDNKSGFGSFNEAMERLGMGENDERFGFNYSSAAGMQHLQDLWVRKINSLKRHA